MNARAAFAFHPAALLEYRGALAFYRGEASESVAENFAGEVEAGVAMICRQPTVCRLLEPPGIRRYLLRRFPFVIYYRWEDSHAQVVIYAVMHTSRKPGYWRTRLQ